MSLNAPGKPKENAFAEPERSTVPQKPICVRREFLVSSRLAFAVANWRIIFKALTFQGDSLELPPMIIVNVTQVSDRVG